MENLNYRIIGQLQLGAKYATYRAIRQQDGLPVVLKVLKANYPTGKDIDQLKHEFTLLQRLQTEFIVEPIALEPFGNSQAIVTREAKGARVVDIIKNKPLDVPTFYSIAMRLVQAVRGLHQHRIIHKNISPADVLFDMANQQLTLCGFSLAAELAREVHFSNSIDAFDGNLAYISPEQTGRINRALDHRTDLYSLGCLFYTMLTGQPPFQSEDPMELVHAHIALPPAPPHTLVADLPRMLSQIVLRLLAKSPEDRYQSAAGLLTDLERSWKSYASSTHIADFPLGEKDVSDQFQIPQKLYGRVTEFAQLLQAYQRAEAGQTEVVLISGYSGVGKSGLVQEAQKAISQRNGLFIGGKFDQLKRDIPLSSLVAAFRRLIRQLLTLDDKQIADWQQKMMTALGQSGYVLTTVVPELTLLIGQQPPVPELPPVEANNRFNQLFDRFVNVFVQPEHPLCIFLDDLQWIDSASRQWVETRLSDQSLGHFLFIGAYRDNEVSASHPLMMMIDRLIQQGPAVTHIHLQPLDTDTLGLMIADTLVTTPEQCTDLTELIHQKTGGNPFFSRQCLLSLYEEKAIYFTPEKQVWAYNLDAVRQTQISDNVVELMADLIQRLPLSVQNLLKTAACIDNQFDLATLSLVSEQELEETKKQLSLALLQGLVVPVHTLRKDDVEEFAFLHDRVQQAALTLMHEFEKQRTRLQIGRLLLQKSVEGDPDYNVYDIADHLNSASHLIDDSTEKRKLMELNLAASIRAKNSSAYEPALRYINVAMELVPRENWDQPSVLTRELLLQRAESEHLCGNNQSAEFYFDQAVVHATTTLDRSRIYQHKIHYYTNLGKFELAYKTGREAVGQLGVNLPASFFPPAFGQDLVMYHFLIGRRKIHDIIHIKEMTDERLRMAVLLMGSFARAAYQIKPELCIAVCARIVNICLRYGNTDGGSNGFLAFGSIFMGAIMNRKQTGFDFGQLTIALVEKFKSLTYKAEAYFVVGYFAVPWRRPALEMERYWQIAYEAGLETGDLFHASCACCGTIQSYYMRGMNFDDILSAADRYLEFLHRIHNREAILTLQAVRQSIFNLRGETDSHLSYNSGTFNEADYVSELSRFGARHFAHYYYINKMQTLYLWGEYTQAYTLSLQSDQYLKDSPGMLHTAEHYFYKGMIICALYPASTGIQRLKWKRILSAIYKKFEGYAAGSPANFSHKWYLLGAEISLLKKDAVQAEKLYYAAIDSARQHGYSQIQALASELLGRYHYQARRHREAGFHLRDAVYGFQKLGATQYAQELVQRYPALLDSVEENESNRSKASGVVLVKNGEGSLDLTTILRSSEAISREIRLPDLLSTLMKIIIQNAGGQRMVLLLQRGNELVIQGEYVADSTEEFALAEVPVNEYERIARSVVNYVVRTQEPVLLDNATTSDFANDAYIQAESPRAILCAPLLQLGKIIGVIYLENNLTNAAFTQDRINLLILLSGQMAISIENALLYKNLEDKVNERTAELNQSLHNLKVTQNQLIQKEKMASLGELVAGIAHEIQNPLNFVNNFSEIGCELVDELKEELLRGDTEEMIVIADSLSANLQKITNHGKRASGIVKGMLEHSRSSSGERTPTKLNRLIDEYLRLAYQGMLAKMPNINVELITSFDPNPAEVVIIPQDIGRVLLNLFNNSFYAVSEKGKQMTMHNVDYHPIIRVTTRQVNDRVEISVEDNGTGIPEAAKTKIFQPFFTTKPTGEGTGLGLSISYDIITKGHNGSLSVETEQGEFTRFVIILPIE